VFTTNTKHDVLCKELTWAQCTGTQTELNRKDTKKLKITIDHDRQKTNKSIQCSISL